MLRLIRSYYLATPAFYLADRLFGLNVRVAFLDQWPAGRTAYYVFAFLLGLVAWRRPAWTVQIGLLESSANVGLLILSVFVWYLGVLEAAGSEFGRLESVAPETLVNFVVAAAIAGASYTIQRTRAER
ncbi:MAG TPA: hypothetical protein VGQ06_06690 [Gemmatimonadales bacterium]|jgi:hypothetical protein|nr:hypothetical protein [Gemmatimonadales bacterium]